MKTFFNQRLFLLNKNLINGTVNIETKSRNNTILPYYLGKTIKVHNGKIFTKITIIQEMIGHKLGEFAKTRKTFKFKKK